jgi:hypothetical protein
MKPRLERWIIFGNCLVGYLFDHPKFSPGTRVKTDAMVGSIDHSVFEVRCIDDDYKLGEPGTTAEHNEPLL